MRDGGDGVGDGVGDDGGGGRDSCRQCNFVSTGICGAVPRFTEERPLYERSSQRTAL